MHNVRELFSRRIEQRHGEITRYVGLSLTRESWIPAMNVFRCDAAFVIWVDLAGVEQSHIDLDVEPLQVKIRGQRAGPEPGESQPALRVLALEINDGPFERVLVLPEEVEPQQVQVEHRNGLLWIHLPLRIPG